VQNKVLTQKIIMKKIIIVFALVSSIIVSFASCTGSRRTRTGCPM